MDIQGSDQSRLENGRRFFCAQKGDAVFFYNHPDLIENAEAGRNDDYGRMMNGKLLKSVQSFLLGKRRDILVLRITQKLDAVMVKKLKKAG
jgi:hypothetical protein